MCFRSPLTRTQMNLVKNFFKKYKNSLTCTPPPSPTPANKQTNTFPAWAGNAPYILPSKFSCLVCRPPYFVSYLSIIHSSLILHLAVVCAAWHPPTRDTARLCSFRPPLRAEGGRELGVRVGERYLLTCSSLTCLPSALLRPCAS